MRRGHLGLVSGLVCVVALLACGDDGGGDGPGVEIDKDGGRDAGHDAGGRKDSSVPVQPVEDASRPMRDAAPIDDAGADAADAFNPFDYDASYFDGAINIPPVPEEWSCPADLWGDGTCDCGCGATDHDCIQFSCSEPGCLPDGPSGCVACFTEQGTWSDCSPEPHPSDWTCEMARRGDDTCDCGCGSPDPACHGQGCTEPGCRKAACDLRHGCAEAIASGVLDPDDDQCSKNPGSIFGLGNDRWHCSRDHYGSGDGCDCGCGVRDPDCDALTGCVDARCFNSACDLCHDQFGNPYPCAAAEAGWDNDADEAAPDPQPSLCEGRHFAAGDGCDCGCGGMDPDCGEGEGCAEPGCQADGCVRCTDLDGLEPIGCAPSEWLAAMCKPESYGTGDGCDCGCGVPDPDCADHEGCTQASCEDAACDVCHDGQGDYVMCPSWQCGAFDANCDCGCGAIDPYCREFGLLSCTEQGCETPVCDYCNEDGSGRVACGGGWTCDESSYGLDGLCDCGCGTVDPDCAEGMGCGEMGCFAPGCEVCHAGSLINACYPWTCAPEDEPDNWVGYGADDGCDCGCGLPDPDCDRMGCEEPGCDLPACEICHDPQGRTVPCRGE